MLPTYVGWPTFKWSSDLAKEGGRACLTDGERRINGGGVSEGGRCMLSLAGSGEPQTFVEEK